MDTLEKQTIEWHAEQDAEAVARLKGRGLIDANEASHLLLKIISTIVPGVREERDRNK